MAIEFTASHAALNTEISVVKYNITQAKLLINVLVLVRVFFTC